LPSSHGFLSTPGWAAALAGVVTLGPRLAARILAASDESLFLGAGVRADFLNGVGSSDFDLPWGGFDGVFAGVSETALFLA
jgi:hypothetical protein